MDVRPFRSAEDFLNSSLSREVACVITDVNMPGMSGFELQQRLLARGSRVPVVFITAFGDPAMRARALRAGACGFLEKPFEDDDLIESVRRAIRT
jgi:FixJ family two-component response regulator